MFLHIQNNYFRSQDGFIVSLKIVPSGEVVLFKLREKVEASTMNGSSGQTGFLMKRKFRPLRPEKSISLLVFLASSLPLPEERQVG